MGYASLKQSATSPSKSSSARAGAFAGGTSHHAPGPMQHARSNLFAPSIRVGRANDPLEGEADRAADAVMSGRPVFDWSFGRVSVYPQRKCAACTEEDKAIQRKSLPGRSGPSGALPAVSNEVVPPGGRPLDSTTRRSMEQSFGHDFSNVRVHVGPRAARSAAALGAKAFTLGSDIVLGDKAPAPETPEGTHLLAHELTHVIQQGQGGMLVQKVGLDDEKPTAEQLRDPPQADTLDDGDSDSDSEDEIEDEESDEDVEDGDTDVPGLDDTPDQESPSESPEPLPPWEHGPEPLGEEPAKAGALGGPLTPEQEAAPLGPGGKPKPKPKPKPSKAKDPIVSISVDQAGSHTMALKRKSGKTTSHTVSTGKGRCGTTADPCPTQNELNCTPRGTFTLVSRGDAATKNSKGDAMAWFVGLAVPGRSGIGIHNSQIADGTPRSHGCIRTGKGGAGLLLAHTINTDVLIGTTKVTISGKAKTKPYPCPKKKGTGKKKKGKAKRKKSAIR